MMKTEMITKDFWGKAVCLIVLSLFTALILTVLFWGKHNNIIYAIRSSADEVKEYRVSDFVPTNYDVNENHFISTNDDPQLLLEDIKFWVESIEVVFSEPLPQGLNVQIYYNSKPNEAFSAEKLVANYAQIGDLSVIINIGKYCDDLRLDLGGKQGVEFELEKVCFYAPSRGQVMKNAVYGESSVCFFIERLKILTLICAYFFIHVLWGWKKVFNKFFEKRWVVASVFLFFMVINRYHGDSFAIYDCVQPESGSEFVETIIGEARAIRSDEYIVTNAKALSSRFLDSVTDKYTPIVRGTKTLNDFRLTWYSILDPISVIRVIISCIVGYEYGYSFYWYARIIFTLLINIEFFLIVTDKGRLLSLVAACMTTFSSFYLWWNFPDLFYSVPAFLVCFYYFLACPERKKRVFFTVGAGVFGANFVTYLYPAWQVPLVYMMLAFMVWTIMVNWNEIRRMKWNDYALIVIAVVLCGVLTGGYMLDKREYMEVVTNTVYPGSRISTGGFCLNKIFDYIPGTMFAFKDIENPSECGVIMTFFPIPIILAIYNLFKKKKWDWLIFGTLVVSAGLLVYVTTGIPEWLAQITLLSYSPGPRALDILAYCQLIMLVRSLTLLDQEDKLPIVHAGLIAIVVAVFSILYARNYTGDYMEATFMLWAEVAIVLIIIGLIGNVDRKYFQMTLIAIITISIVSSALVRPLSKGLDAIDSKPVAHEIRCIIEGEENTKWIAYGGGSLLAAFSIACGAPTINSTNTYPNMELWKKLDPNGYYTNIYNRYEHVLIQFTEEATSFELIQSDVIQINLSYEDIKLTGVNYVLSFIELESNEYVMFECLYSEDGIYIYKVSS